MGFKEKYIKFNEKSYIDLIVYLIVSILIFYYNWEAFYLKYIAIIVTILGFTIWITGRIQLGGSFQLDAKAKNLVTSGVYSKIRHPIYFGGFLVMIGWVLYVFKTSLFIFLLFLIILYIILQIKRIRNEETVLKNKYKNKYTKYKEKTIF